VRSRNNTASAEGGGPDRRAGAETALFGRAVFERHNGYAVIALFWPVATLFRLQIDAKSLAKINIPNRDGSSWTQGRSIGSPLVVCEYTIGYSSRQQLQHRRKPQLIGRRKAQSAH
jgi:hypothetical protein